jgi:hypothetical protein
VTQPPPTHRNGRPPAGEFPQPTSPWESRGLLYAEVAGALAVLAMVLFIDTRDLGRQPEPAAAQAAQSAPAATFSTATVAQATDPIR